MKYLNKKGAIALIIILVFLVAGGIIYKNLLLKNSEKAEIENSSEENTKIANPAAVKCEEEGGKSEIKSYPSGNQYGICLFSDGSQCKQWDFFRGDCDKGEKFCEDLCGDGICQEIVCQEVGCPCPETGETCGEDCQ